MEDKCEALGCDKQAEKGIDYCRPHANGMIGCGTIIIIILSYLIYHLISNI